MGLSVWCRARDLPRLPCAPLSRPRLGIRCTWFASHSRGPLTSAAASGSSPIMEDENTYRYLGSRGQTPAARNLPVLYPCPRRSHSTIASLSADLWSYGESGSRLILFTSEASLQKHAKEIQCPEQLQSQMPMTWLTQVAAACPSAPTMMPLLPVSLHCGGLAEPDGSGGSCAHGHSGRVRRLRKPPTKFRKFGDGYLR